MEKDVGRIKKNSETEVVVRIDEYNGKKGLTIREFVTSPKYTGFTKSGTRIPVESFDDFKKLINSIDPKDLKSDIKEAEKKSGEEETDEEF